MATKLTNLVITKVALVDEGSCSEAHIKLYKRREGGSSIMDYSAIIKSLPEDQRKVIEDEVTKAKSLLPEGAMSAEDKKKLELEKQAALDEVNTLKKQASGESDEDILKSANLDPAVKAIIEKNIAKAKASEVILMKMQEEKENTEIVNKAKTLTVIPEVDTKVTEFLKSIKGVDGAIDAAMEILKSANALIEKGGALGELGAAGGAGGTKVASETAWAAIEKAAESKVVKGKISKEKAVEMVTSEQPQLYEAYLEALRSESE